MLRDSNYCALSALLLADGIAKNSKFNQLSFINYIDVIDFDLYNFQIYHMMIKKVLYPILKVSLIKVFT